VERFKFKKSEKMMRKDVSGGQRSKFIKSEKMKKTFQEVERFKFIKSEKMKKDVSGGGKGSSS
jgi:isopentenyl phosphate kinase